MKSAGKPAEKHRPGPPSSSFHPDAQAEADDVITQTGVYNAGNTCYQNAVYRLLVISTAIRTAMDSATMSDEYAKLHGASRLIFDLVEAIHTGSFEMSKDHLRGIWKYFQELHDKDKIWRRDRQEAIDSIRAEAELEGSDPPVTEDLPSDILLQFHVGEPLHQDATEFLQVFLMGKFEIFLKTAWGHERTSEVSA